MKQIVGAGLAGLIAGHAWPQAKIFEAAPEPTSTHKAVLRFRSDAVSRITGIEFRKVLVRKGIFSRGQFVAPNIALANTYAQKVLGFERLVGDRSIWNLEPVERFVAPEDFHEQMVDAMRGRIEYGRAFEFDRNRTPVVSTAPLPVVLKAVNLNPYIDFVRAPITVQRWRIHNCDVFQTVYFPDLESNLYRASITGNMLIAEYAGEADRQPEPLLERAFGISLGAFAEDKGVVEQRYGKIVDIPAAVRKQLLFDLTLKHNVYSLGRFATYRNILLDSVVDDITVIKKLLKANSSYELRQLAQ